MGILESCENPGINDPRMSLSVDSSFFNLPGQNSCYSGGDFYFQQSKIHLFGDIFYKKQGDKTQFVMQTHMTNRATQVLNHSLKIYTDSATFMHQKGNKIKIITSIDDPNRIGEQLYLIKIHGKPKQVILKLIPFNRYEDQKFKKGLYQIAMLHYNLRQQNNRFGFVYQDAFVIESGIDKDSNDKCFVIVGDFATATLDQMINYRKMAKMAWTEKQFQTVAYQLIRGVSQMHKTRLFHRDIRPYNIYYSPDKKGYVLGGFGNAINLTGVPNGIGTNLAAVPYYLPFYLKHVGQKENYSQYYNYDPEQSDIYSLGLTLLNTLFLDQFLPPEALKQSAVKYQQKYRLLSTITQMLEENPPSLTKILSLFPEDTGSRVLDERNQVEAYRFRTKPQDEQFVSKKKLIASGYYQMFMYDQWVQEINEVVNYYELNQDHLQLADIYKQIAQIYSQHHQDQLMIQYYCKASSIFLSISDQCIKQNKNQQAIKYLQKGIDCNRKGYRCQPNTDLAYLLNKLAMANHTNQQYEIARAFQEEALQIIGKVNGDSSPQYSEMLIDAAKIQMQFKEFKQAENMLKAGLKIIDKKQPNKQNQSIKARLLESLGNNFRFKAMVRLDKSQVYRSKAQECLLDSLDMIERAQGSIHPQVGSVLMSLGNLYFDRRQYDKAKKSYQKALIVKKHSNKGKQTVELGQCLTCLANSQKFLHEYEKAVKHYDQSIQVFRKTYGNDHNPNTAIAIGNLGLLYKQMGRRNQERQYLNLAKGILKDLFGESCPDYQYFDKQLTR